ATLDCSELVCRVAEIALRISIAVTPLSASFPRKQLRRLVERGTRNGHPTLNHGCYSRKKVVAAAAIEQSGLQTTLLKSVGRSRKDTGLCARAFRRALCRRARRGGLVSHWFLRGILCGACCWFQKQE